VFAFILIVIACPGQMQPFHHPLVCVDFTGGRFGLPNNSPALSIGVKLPDNRFSVFCTMRKGR
jgi:hypothetical protein